MTLTAQATRRRLPEVAPAMRVVAVQGTGVRAQRWPARRRAIALSTLGAVVAMGPIVLLNWSRWSRAPVRAFDRRRRRKISAPGPGPGVALNVMPSPEAKGTTVPASSVGDGHPDQSVCSGAWIDPLELTVDRAAARDGTVVHLRLLRRDERDPVVSVFNGLSADSRYHAFLQPMPRLPKAYLDRLVDVDGRRHLAVVAIVEGECVGIARCIALPDEPGAANAGITVIDRYQGRGIGRLLVEALGLAAVRAGLTTFVCEVHPYNQRAKRLLRSLGVELAYKRRSRLDEGRLRLPEQPLTSEPWTTLMNSGGLVGHGPFTRNCGEQSVMVTPGVSHR